jgi:hypothetical protein
VSPCNSRTARAEELPRSAPKKGVTGVDGYAVGSRNIV